MSMISEQVKHLKELSDTARANVYSFEALSQSLREAADTIESLSAKLKAANMERLTKDCGGWIYCGDGKNLPKEKEWYMTTCVVGNGSPFSQELYFDGAKFDTEEIEAEYYYTLCKVLAWQPLPNPYHEP